MKKQKPVPELPKDQDHLEAYPEKKQVSAFPERRFIKTNRFLVILALVNLACMLAGSGIFIYAAKRADVKVQNERGLLLYQLDNEEKRLKQAEYKERKIPARQLIMEDYLTKYIKERHSCSKDDTQKDFSERLSDKSFVLKSSSGATQQIKKEIETLQRETVSRGIIRDVHIYNLHLLTRRGENYLWTAFIETFDFPKPDGFPVCNCFDNSPTCLKCKYEKTIQRQRKRIWIRATMFNSQKDTKWVRRLPEDVEITRYDNPFGIQILGYYVGYMPKDAPSQNWDLPPELTSSF